MRLKKPPQKNKIFKIKRGKIKPTPTKKQKKQKTSITTILQLIVVKILTLREVIGAAGLVIKHRDTDVLEVLSPLCEALTLQTSSPQNQPTLEQALHEAQAR